MKFDPKLLKKINQSHLIQAAVAVGLKNATKVSKESLVTGFVAAVDKILEPMNEEEKLEYASKNEKITEIYNLIVTTLGLDETEQKEGDDPKSSKKAKEGKPKKEKVKKEKKEIYSGVSAVVDAIKVLKYSFTMESLLKKANELYAEKNNKTKYDLLDRRYLLAVPVLLGLGMAKKDGDKITISK